MRHIQPWEYYPGVIMKRSDGAWVTSWYGKLKEHPAYDEAQRFLIETKAKHKESKHE
jgi:fructose-1,6-bisphosphatase/inositol monophosphatase family enzyme